MPNCSICGTPYCQWEVRDDIASCPVCDVAPEYTETKIGEGTLFTVNPKPIHWSKPKKGLIFIGTFSTNNSWANKVRESADKFNDENNSNTLQAEFRKMRAEAEAEVQRQMDEIRRKLDEEKE